MHEYMEILPKYMLKCHLGSTQTQTNTMGHNLIENIKIFLQKLEVFPNPIKK